MRILPGSLLQKRLARPMPPRDPHEHHRAATTLELLFDLVFVIAIAAAAAGLHHAIAENHAADGVIRFVIAFFAIWWAWMNYTWFASAYDNDDTIFRVLTMVIMAGALVMAASIGQLFAVLDATTTIIGYIIMRIAMIALWLRAARHDPAHRETARRYAMGIALVQVFWLVLLMVDPGNAALFYLLFVIGGLCELAVPAFAERKSITPWHRHHIIERYGLLNIIVLGESLLAATMALQQATDNHFDANLIRIAVAALVIVFMLWWVYFTNDEHLGSQDLGLSLTWGYGHAVIFAAGAAVGAGFAVSVDVITHHADISHVTADLAVAIPLALYLAGLWFVRDRFCLAGNSRLILPGFAVLVLLAPLTPFALEAMAALMVAAACVRSTARRV